LNFWVASLLTLVGLAWFAYTQRAARGEPPPEEIDREPVPAIASTRRS
jgi:hypothetical protein